MVAVASGCKKLTSFHLHFNSNITDEALAALSGCKKLKWLDLMGCENITDEAVVALASECKTLVWLDLDNEYNQITDASDRKHREHTKGPPGLSHCIARRQSDLGRTAAHSCL